MFTVKSLKDKFYDHVAQTSDFPIGLTIRSAEGPYLYLDDGTQIIDLISGIAVSSIGHRHPAVIDAIKTQLDRHLHVMVYGEFILEAQAEFASNLTSLLPPSLSSVYFTSSGTEAVEGALKLAKKFTRRKRLVSFERSYHGDTHGSLSVTGRDIYKDPFKPLLPDVRIVDFNEEASLGAVDENVAAVIVEPIQGEGGIRVADFSWLQSLRQRCSDTGALLIFDEIQTGMGRTGALFAFEHYDAVPDILCSAKALGGGMPLGAFIASEEIMAAFKTNPPLSHVTTFGGHPVSCAAANAALKLLVDDELPARAQEIERRVRNSLAHPAIKEIRGKGAMLGMVLPDSEITADIVKECLERGVLLGWTLHSDNLVRIAPPLNIEWEVLDQAIQTILDALNRRTSTQRYRI